MNTPQAIILVGGKGTRLSALYPNIPKALVPVAGKPFLAWQIEWLVAGGISEIVLSAGHLGTAIAAWAADHRFGGRIRTIIEPTPLGTGGALKYIQRAIGACRSWVVNGDTLLPGLDFGRMEESHLRAGVPGTVAVTTSENSGRYGTIHFNPSGIITRFNEKSSDGSGWVNGGIYLLNLEFFADLTLDKPISIEQDVFPRLASAGSLAAFQVVPPLLDMGTPEGLRKMTARLGGQV